MTPTEDYFLRAVPAAIVRDLGRFRHLHGTLAFSCAGEKFTVSMGNLDRPVMKGFLRSADVRVWFFRDAFVRYLAGELVSGKKHVLVQGDADVLDRFGKFLQPASTSLSVRFAEATL